MDDTVPSDTPGPISITIPLSRKSLEETEKPIVGIPSSAPVASIPELLERLSSHIPQYGLDDYGPDGEPLEIPSIAAPFQNLPVKSSSTDDGVFIPLAEAGPTAQLHSLLPTGMDDDLVLSPSGINNFDIAMGKHFFLSAKEFSNSLMAAGTDKM